jgi:hypothetical protein
VREKTTRSSSRPGPAAHDLAAQVGHPLVALLGERAFLPEIAR